MRIYKDIKSQLGFSMIEVLIATGISAIVAVGSGAVIIQAVQNEQRAQAVADASRAADILKNTIFRRNDNMDGCTESLVLGAGGFSTANLADPNTGVKLRVNGLPSFGAGGFAEEGQSTPYGDIVDFSIVADNGAPEFTDTDGNDVYAGILVISFQKGPKWPVTQISLGSIGLRIAADDSLQGCAIVTGEGGLDLPKGGGTGDPDCDDDYLAGGRVNGHPGGPHCGGVPLPAAAANAAKRCSGEPAQCPNGQGIVLIDEDLTDDQGACIACQNIVESTTCACIDKNDNAGTGNGDGDCQDPGDGFTLMTGINPGGTARNCQEAPDPDMDGDDVIIQRRDGTPTPTQPLPTNNPMLTPTPVIPIPTAHPTTTPVMDPVPTPTPPPTPTPNLPTPTPACGAESRFLNCEEVCIYEGWKGWPGINNCTDICPPPPACPTPASTPSPTIVPTSTPFIAPPMPTPINAQCNCGGVIIDEGNYCGTCFQEFEPEFRFTKRAYIYIDRRSSFRCLSGDLIAMGRNSNIGPCGRPGGGLRVYENSQYPAGGSGTSLPNWTSGP